MGKKKFDTFTRLLIVIVSLAGFTIYAGVMVIMNQIWNPEALSIADKELILHRITINNCIEQVLRGTNHAAFLLMIIYACVSKIIHLNKELKFFAAEITWVLSITFLFVLQVCSIPYNDSNLQSIFACIYRILGTKISC